MRNEHHFSSISTPAAFTGSFIGIAARFAAALALLPTLMISSCDETKTTTAAQPDPAPAGDETVLDRPPRNSEPREVRWSPDGNAADAARPTAEELQPILAGAPDREGWAIVLTTFTDQDHRANATRWLALFQEATSMPGAWIETGERGSTVRYGSYPAVESKQAQQDLSKIKNFVYKDQLPFARAYLSRYGMTQTAGRLREFHLSQALKLFPGEDTVYSLQIAVYEAEQETTAEQARRLAEEAVMQLRAQGEMAFYYHGPHRSMVCLGAFPSTAADGATGFYSPEVSALQRRFPYNSFNGRSLKQDIITMSGQKREELQPSFLVQVPRE